MRILQLSSDWKWTGPAEPMLLLAAALRARDHEVDLACPGPPPAEAALAADEAERSLASEADAAGLTPVLRIPRGRAVRPLRDRAVVAELARCLEDRDVELVHTWHSRDHVLALRAVRARRGRTRTRVVRSYARAEPIPATPWNRWLFGPGCDGLVCVSPKSAERNRPLRGRRPTLGCFGVADPRRFPSDESGSAGDRDARQRARAAARLEFGVAPDQPLLGVVARVQRHRRFDLLFSAMQRLARDHPDARLLVLGRGTHFDEIARRPVERLGLRERVILAGYRRGDYPRLLRALDLFTYLVPGSDGTCRALLEASACGIPTVASQRGALPEIVQAGVTGTLVPEEPEALASAWSALLCDPGARRRMGRAARARAARLFVPDRFAQDVEGLYRAALPGRIAREDPAATDFRE